MLVAADYSWLKYYDINNNDHEVKCFKTLDVSEIPSDWLIFSRQKRCLETNKLFSDENYDILRVIPYDNFTITNTQGETLIYDAGYLSGTMEVLDENFVESGVEDYAELVFKVHKSDGYSFASGNSRAYFTVEDSESYTFIDAENASNITIDKASRISVESNKNDLNYKIYTTTANCTNFFVVSGQTPKYVNIALLPDGSASINADTLSGSVIKSLYEEDVTYVLDGVTNSIEIVETTDGGLVLSSGVYKITFNANGGTVTPATAITDASGKLITTLPTPIRDGYTFNGWYTAVDSGEKVGEGKLYTADTTLYAQWTKIVIPPTPATYIITFDANGGAVSTATMTTRADGKLPSLPTASRASYTFDGWYTETNEGTQITTNTVFDRDITVYAHWTYSGSSGGNTGGGSSSGSSGSSHGSGTSGSSTNKNSIAVPNTTGGKITVSPKSAAKGTTVTITATPDDGYELVSLTVTGKDGSAVTLSSKGDGKYTFTMPASKVEISAKFDHVEDSTSNTPWRNPFADVSSNAYYYDAVRWAVEQGITKGSSGTTFSPNEPCTRAQAVTFLWRAAGSPSPQRRENRFADVNADAYYYEAVIWAAEQGITTGTSTAAFSPNKVVTRGQTVTFLYRAAGSPTTDSGKSFEDTKEGAYYFDAVRWATEKGITGGTTATAFNPNSNCTRAQIVTFLYRAQ